MKGHIQLAECHEHYIIVWMVTSEGKEISHYIDWPEDGPSPSHPLSPLPASDGMLDGLPRPVLDFPPMKQLPVFDDSLLAEILALERIHLQTLRDSMHIHPYMRRLPRVVEAQEAKQTWAYDII